MPVHKYIYIHTNPSAHLTLLKTMSTSVLVTALPSITPHSFNILEKFLPVMSLPVAAVSPYTANLRKAFSSSDIPLHLGKGNKRRKQENFQDLLISSPHHDEKMGREGVG